MNATQKEAMDKVVTHLKEAADLIAHLQLTDNRNIRAVAACTALEMFAVMTLPQTSLAVTRTGHRDLSFDRKMALTGNEIICQAIAAIKEKQEYPLMVTIDKAAQIQD